MHRIGCPVRSAQHHRLGAADARRPQDAVHVAAAKHFAAAQRIAQREVLRVGFEADLAHLGLQPDVRRIGAMRPRGALVQQFGGQPLGVVHCVGFDLGVDETCAGGMIR